ncbi:YbaB/EbfC DNA-binding family protein [Amycolatopsis australiensis]|uniref:YbaB/EbfC DNA-binding family protein n=2 Tax=Amycolatopsis australiensis TaxID=546364 RepID=A0A1K1RQ88_9PSEU|nr:YbaB/EbfC DNA-binding family protein [Amycolatopsis australiensis]
MNRIDPASAEMPEIVRRAAEAKARLQHLSATATSPDGAVTVTVNTSGALQELSFGPRADELPRTRLAEAVLAAARRAQIDAAQQLTSVMAPVIGDDSAAMSFLREQIPAPESPAGEPRRKPPSDDDFGGPILRRGL